MLPSTLRRVFRVALLLCVTIVAGHGSSSREKHANILEKREYLSRNPPGDTANKSND